MSEAKVIKESGNAYTPYVGSMAEYRRRRLAELENDVLSSLKDGMRFTFTKSNRYPNDKWLNLEGRSSITVKLTRGDDDVWMVNMRGEEPVRLEDTPRNFWASLRQHIQENKVK